MNVKIIINVNDKNRLDAFSINYHYNLEIGTVCYLSIGVNFCKPTFFFFFTRQSFVQKFLKMRETYFQQVKNYNDKVEV